MTESEMLINSMFTDEIGGFRYLVIPQRAVGFNFNTQVYSFVGENGEVVKYER